MPGTTSKPQRWFLDGGHSGTAKSANDGILARAAGPDGGDRFTVDYNLPPPDYFAFWAGPMDAHGLSYTTAPLTAPLTLVGSPVAHLAVSADRPDADVFVYVDEIHPDGKDEVLSFGAAQAVASQGVAGTVRYARTAVAFGADRRCRPAADRQCRDARDRA